MCTDKENKTKKKKLNMTEIDSFKQMRSIALQGIARIKEHAGKEKQMSAQERSCRLEILEQYFKEALDRQKQIEQLDFNDEGRPEIEELYILTKVLLQGNLQGNVHNSTIADLSSYMQPAPRSKLPKLKLPSFGGQYAEFKNFFNSFSQLVDSEHSLSDIEKFNHLLNCLHGQALETVKAFQITSENYPKAIGRLKARYDNNTLIFLDNIASLFKLSSISKPNSSQLRNLVDNAAALYDSLLSLGSEKQISEAMLIYLVIEKADVQTKKKWNESLTFKELPTWNSCSDLLEKHCQYLESLDGSNSATSEPSSGERSSKIKGNQRYSFSCASGNNSCMQCSSNDHVIIHCPQFKKMDVSQRFELVKKLNLCLNCLSKSHLQSNCPSKFRCRFCSKRHHTLLHRKNDNQNFSIGTNLSVDATDFTPNAVVHTHMKNSTFNQIILATAVVLVRDAFGSYKIGRALLDSCSQVNFITEEFSQTLRLPRKKHHLEILSIGQASTDIKHSTSTSIKSRKSGFELPLSFCITSHIAYQPEAEIEVSSWKIPSNLELADEEFFKSRRIDLLLGAESFFDLLAVGQIKLGPSLPLLQKTLLGWVVSGRYTRQPGIPKSSSACLLSIEESIDENLQHLWKLDEVSRTVDMGTTEHGACEVLFMDTVRRDPTGRVVVRLPFKDYPGKLGDSYQTAFRRFLGIERKLLKSPDLKSQYSAFLDEYEQLGHMSEVKHPDLSISHYYVPHHCVLRPSSTSTKLRVVFDASCMTTSGKSLNNLLMVGPTIQPELFHLLLRFRLFKFALTADIVKMYRQVLVDQKDRKFQYILWRKSPQEQIRTYALNTVTYGTAAAPFLAIRSLNFIADEYSSQFPLGSDIIKSSFYVDDLLCGADSLEQLSLIKTQVTEILKRGCFQLDKWHSNHPHFMDDKTIKDINLDEGSVTSALGIKWDQRLDQLLFSFNPKQVNTNSVTKRSILSIASSLFDPLGLVSPIIITAKIILQELWLLKLSWDESVPQNLHSAWQNLLADLSTLQLLSIPRYCFTSTFKVTEIHGFCDSSIRAYGCCLYIRTEDAAGNISVQLLTSKSRVAPTKSKSLPKLELCGALTLSRLYDKVKGMSHFNQTNVFLWTDSQIVIHWLKCHSATLSAFVGNRVSEIQDLTAKAQWRHVPTKSNPADLVSRGCSVADLKVSMWFNGPSFLLQPIDKWPKSESTTLDMEEVNKEKRKAAFVAVLENNHLLSMLSKFSSHVHCLKILAWMIRFRNNSVNNRINAIISDILSPDELRNAFACLIWNLQQQHFQEDIRSIKKGETSRHSLKNLNPFLQETNGFELLKVGGRLELSELPATRKHPILLPSKSPFVKNYVRHLHLSNYHAGAKALVALVQLEYWVINAREVARSVVKSCMHCVRYRPKLLRQIMGNLPPERISPSRPFSHCGIDFCGPVNTYLRIRGKMPYKTYIAIFICFATKAIHIEIVSDLSTDAFLAALKRMIGRRGLPSDIYCDNATNFVGASNKLSQLKNFMFQKQTQADIAKYCSNNFFNFHFIPPRAPHFGGLWEAAVKSAKGHLNRSFINTRFTYEELLTALVEIEAILNSRPLTASSSDPNDLEPLTPAHFLVGTSLKALPERDVPIDQLHLVDKWTRVSIIKQHFWKSWQNDYLNELQVRSKWQNDRPNIKADSMVLVHEDNVPPLHWVLGRVIHEIPGKDSLIRVVDVRTAKGVIRRPIRKLALLPA